jgi:hypothetical protein
MNSEDWSVLLLLVALGLSTWLILLFVLLYKRVKAIQAILMAAYDVEECMSYEGASYKKGYRKRESARNSPNPMNTVEEKHANG